MSEDLVVLEFIDSLQKAVVKIRILYSRVPKSH